MAKKKIENIRGNKIIQIFLGKQAFRIKIAGII